MRRLILALVGAISAEAAAQSTPLADSVMRLNRAGLWEQAGQLAQASWSKTSSPDERCGLQAMGAYALVRTGRLEAANQNIKAFDDQCAGVATAAQYKLDLEKLRQEVTLPSLPTTGLDFSGMDAFWPVVDVLARDVEPSAAQWHTLFSTIGYRLSIRMVNTTQRDMEIALRPSNRALFDSLAKLPDTDDDANRIRHIARAVTHRAELLQYRDSVTSALPIAQAIARAAQFLPPHATDGKRPPLVAFAIFRDDAYSLGQQIVVDLDHVYVEGGLTDLLAHEFHHSYLSTLNRLQFSTLADPSGPLLRALNNARNEGIADLIDKPHPLAFDKSPGMAAYAKRYNAAYARTPQVIQSIDSALAVAAGDSTKLREVGARVAQLLPSNGHYNGSYVAREIYETFGVDSLYPGVSNPFAFWRTYGEAERRHGRPWPFSAKAQQLLDALEKTHIR
jgi:hypothetical protein